MTRWLVTPFSDDFSTITVTIEIYNNVVVEKAFPWKWTEMTRQGRFSV